MSQTSALAFGQLKTASVDTSLLRSFDTSRVNVVKSCACAGKRVFIVCWPCVQSGCSEHGRQPRVQTAWKAAAAAAALLLLLLLRVLRRISRLCNYNMRSPYAPQQGRSQDRGRLGGLNFKKNAGLGSAVGHDVVGNGLSPRLPRHCIRPPENQSCMFVALNVA